MDDQSRNEIIVVAEAAVADRVRSALSEASGPLKSSPDLARALQWARSGAGAIIIEASDAAGLAAERVTDVRLALPDMPLLALVPPGDDSVALAMLGAGADECVHDPHEIGAALQRAAARRRSARLSPAQSESERRLAAIHANLPGLIYRRTLTPDGTIRYDYVSPSPMLLAQGNVPTASSSGVLARTEPEDREPLVKAIHESAADLSLFDFTRRVRAKDGEVRWMRSIATPHREANGDVVWDGIVLDITEQRRAEERLKETEQRLASVAQNIPGDLFRRTLHADGRITFAFVGPNARDMFGIEAEALAVDGRGFVDSIHPEDRPGWLELIRRTAETLERFDCTFRVRGRDGAYRWFQTLATTRKGHEGETIWDGFTLDVDDAKRIEVAFQRSQDRLRLLTDNLPVAVLQLAGGPSGSVSCGYVSGGIKTLIGETPEAVEADAERLLGAIDGADRKVLALALAESEDNLKDVRWHGRVRTVDGAAKWLDAVLHPLRGSDGSMRWDGILLDVTERARISAELAEREHRLANIAQHVPGVIYQRVLHPDGHVTYPYVSAGVKAMYGYDPEEVMKDPSLFPSGIVPEDRPSYRAELERSRATMTPRLWEGRERMRSGEIRWVQVFGQPRRLEDGSTLWDGLILDQTERKRAEQALAENEARLRSITESLPGNVYRRVQHTDGRVSYPFVSWGLLEQFGLDTKGPWANAEKYLALAHPDDQAGLREAYERSCAELAPLAAEYRVVLPSGAVRWVQSSSIPHREPNGDTVWDGITLDVTARREGEETMKQAREVAETANRAKTLFLANMSHELRTPLNAILGFSEVMRDRLHGPLGAAEYEEYVRLIHESGQHLLDVIGDVLDMSKIEAGRYELRQEAVLPTDLVAAAVAIVAPKAAEKGVELRSDVAADLPAALVDRRAARQVLLNLLSNALKFTEAGGVVAVSAATPEPGFIDVTVTDTGIGIAPENMERIFEPFQQVDSSLTRKHEGTGLGLSISKRLMELHGGALGLASEPGVGTAVTARFPVA